MRIASATGQKWAGFFRRDANRLRALGSAESRKDSGRIDVRKTVHDGFVATHTRRKNVITTIVVDTPGRLYGSMTTEYEPVVTRPQPPQYIYTVGARDVFNPMVPTPAGADVSVKAEYREVESGRDIIAFHGDTGYRGSSISIQDSPHNEADLVGMTKTLYPRTNNFWITWFEDLGLYNPSDEDPVFNIRASFMGVNSLIPQYDRLSIMISEHYVFANTGYKFLSRLDKKSKVCRSTAASGTCNKGGKFVTFVPLTQVTPLDEIFPHSTGSIGVYVHACTVLPDAEAEAVYEEVVFTLPIEGMDLGLVKPEKWSDGGLGRWNQEYMDGPDRMSMCYSPGSRYPGQVLPMNDYLSCAFGRAVTSFEGDSAVALIDFKICRTWNDDRRLDIHPSLVPIEIHTQTGMIKIVTPFGKDMATQPAVSLIISDVSGSTQSGAYTSLGGSCEDYHRVWTTEWAGTVYGPEERFVALVSEVRMRRLEDVGPKGQYRSTRSNLFYGTNILFKFDDDLYKKWIAEDYLDTRPAGMQGTPFAPGEQASIVAMYLDGQMTYAEGYTFYYEEGQAERSDYYAPEDTHTWGTVISASKVWFAAYVYNDGKEPTEVAVLEWDLGEDSVKELRRDPTVLDGVRQRPALSCYQREVMDGSGKIISRPGIVYRLGSQVGPGFVQLTKDYGETWHDLLSPAEEGTSNVYSGAIGMHYLGPAMTGARYGEIFTPRIG